MKDGSYYEGSFVDGEICGHGYRVFGGTGSSYTGTSPAIATPTCVCKYNGLISGGTFEGTKGHKGLSQAE